MPKTNCPRLTSIGITARLEGSHRVAVFPRHPLDFSTMPQDFRTEAEARTYATALSKRTGWLWATGQAGRQGRERSSPSNHQHPRGFT
jgi:hypothetical protein